MDDFSKEDFFRDDAPYQLGSNVAIATISDILASGGDPLMYAHSMSIDTSTWDKHYIDAFSEGIAAVLKEIGAGFIGGDLGRSDSWKYTGVAIGETHRPITRIGTKEGDIIFMTGMVGAGNIEATMNLVLNNNFLGNKIDLPRLKLKIRQKESLLIREYATSCIDTSDGVLSGLNTFAELNHVGYQIDNLKYSPEGIRLSQIIGKPLCLLFMGECGEYELLFTINPQQLDQFVAEAEKKNLEFTQIGLITAEGNKSLAEADKSVNFMNFDIRARDFEQIEEYLTELINYVEKNRK